MPADLTVWKWKWKLDGINGDIEKLRMPLGARVVDVGAQGNDLCVWALVDPRSKTETRVFRIAGTGHPLGGDVDYETVYLGRAEFLDGRLQIHVFDLGVDHDAS